MLRDDAVKILTDRLGNRDDLATKAVSEMQLAQIELEQGPDLPWFLLKIDSTLSNSDVSNYDLLTIPSDFIQEFEHDKLRRYDSSATRPWIGLTKNEIGTIYDKGADSSDPTHYGIFGGSFVLGPSMPTKSYTFRLHYFGKASLLTSNIENSWLANAPEVLISATGMKMAPLYAPEMLQVFQGMFRAALGALAATSEARLHAARDYVMEYG